MQVQPAPSPTTGRAPRRPMFVNGPSHFERQQLLQIRQAQASLVMSGPRFAKAIKLQAQELEDRAQAILDRAEAEPEKYWDCNHVVNHCRCNAHSEGW